MIVSIARELGAGGGTVGEALADALSATLLDERAIIERLSDRHGLSPDYLRRTVERPPTLGESLIADLARASAMVPFNTEWRMPDHPIIDRVRALVFECAENGHVVVIGHGGASMLGWRPAGVPILAILLQARRDWRIDQLARRYAISQAEAQRRIARSDDARSRYLRHYTISCSTPSGSVWIWRSTSRRGRRARSPTTCRSRAPACSRTTKSIHKRDTVAPKPYKGAIRSSVGSHSC
jgi:cytidylate kinase